MQPRIVPNRGITLDYLMWLFTRLSGLAMVLLALIGVLGAMLMGARLQVDLGSLMRWTFFPNSFHVVNTNIPDVVPNWANAYWQTMQMLILFFGIGHGFNGLRMVLEDYIGRGFRLLLLRGLIFLLAAFLFIVAVQMVLAS